VSTDLVRADLLLRLEEGGALTATGCDLSTRADLRFDQFQAICALVGRAASAVRWWAGDLVLFGERVYGETAPQALEELRMSPEGLADCARVAAAFPPSKRSPTLSFGHHRTLASRWLEPVQRFQLLERAESGRLSVRELESLVQELRELESRHVTDVKNGCEELADVAARDLRERLTACGYPADMKVSVEIAAPGVSYAVTVG